MNPESLTPRDAPRLLQVITRPETLKIRDYLEGRWLGPEGQEDRLTYWAGPMLPPDHTEYASMKAALLKACAADNLIQSAIETFLDAIEGLEDWRLAPEGTDAPEKPTADEEAVTAYTDRLGLGSLLYHVGLTLAAHGRTVARPVLSPRARNEDGAIKPARDLAEALSRIHWQAPGWPRQSRMVGLESAGLYFNPQTLEPVSLLAYSAPRENGATVPGLEVSWLDESGLTRVRVLEEDRPAQEVTLDLGGRLMLLEATLPRPIVTRSMLGAMDAYVVASTMLNRNTHYAGYVERWAIGVQPPGNRERDPVSGAEVFKPADLDTGPGRFNFFQAESFVETVTDADGTRETQRPAPAQMGRWEPVDPVAITAALDHWRKAIRSEARQSFLELSDSADASGRSREVAAGDYLRSAEKLRVALSGFVRDWLELTLALAALQLGDGEGARLRSYRASVGSRVKAFPPSSEERSINLQEWEKGLVDWETAVTRAGHDDPDAIRQRVEAERAERQAQAAQVRSQQNAEPESTAKPAG